MGRTRNSRSNGPLDRRGGECLVCASALAGRARFDKFLALAEKHGISVIPVLFNDCSFGQPLQMDPFLGPQREPISGMILPSWTPSPGRKLGNDPQTGWFHDILYRDGRPCRSEEIAAIKAVIDGSAAAEAQAN